MFFDDSILFELRVEHFLLSIYLCSYTNTHANRILINCPEHHALSKQNIDTYRSHIDELHAELKMAAVLIVVNRNISILPMLRKNKLLFSKSHGPSIFKQFSMRLFLRSLQLLSVCSTYMLLFVRESFRYSVPQPCLVRKRGCFAEMRIVTSQIALLAL